MCTYAVLLRHVTYALVVLVCANGQTTLQARRFGMLCDCRNSDMVIRCAWSRCDPLGSDRLRDPSPVDREAFYILGFELPERP